MRPPRQRRSEETLSRILQASRELLEERAFADVSVNDIVERAGSSVGAFYARFESKEAVLDSLQESFVHDTSERTRDLVASNERLSNGDPRPLESAIREFVGMVVGQHRAHRGTLRALVGRAIAGHGGQGARGELVPVRPLAEMIRSRRSEIGHANPDVAVELGLGMVLCAVRERVLFPEIGGGRSYAAAVTDAVFAEELARALACFLALKPR